MAAKVTWLSDDVVQETASLLLWFCNIVWNFPFCTIFFSSWAWDYRVLPNSFMTAPWKTLHRPLFIAKGYENVYLHLPSALLSSEHNFPSQRDRSGSGREPSRDRVGVMCRQLYQGERALIKRGEGLESKGLQVSLFMTVLFRMLNSACSWEVKVGSETLSWSLVWFCLPDLTLIMVNVNLTVLYGVGSVVSVFRGTDWGSKTLCHLPKDTQLLTGGRTQCHPGCASPPSWVFSLYRGSWPPVGWWCSAWVVGSSQNFGRKLKNVSRPDMELPPVLPDYWRWVQCSHKAILFFFMSDPGACHSLSNFFFTKQKWFDVSSYHSTLTASSKRSPCEPCGPDEQILSVFSWHTFLLVPADLPCCAVTWGSRTKYSVLCP